MAPRPRAASGNSSGGTRELRSFSEKGMRQISRRMLALVLVAEQTRGHSLEWAGGREGRYSEQLRVRWGR